MKGIVLVAAFVAAPGLGEPTPPAAANRAKPDHAVEAVEALGGRVERDSARAGSPIVAVTLHGYHVTDADLSFLDCLPELEVLDLTATRITDAGLDHLRGLVRLRKLYLYDDQVSDAGLARLVGLKSLEHLDIGCTRVTDSGLPALKQLSRLRSLNASGTRITDEGLEALQPLEGLRSLYVVDTPTTAAAVKKLRRRLPKATIENRPRSIMPRHLQPWWLQIISGG